MFRKEEGQRGGKKKRERRRERREKGTYEGEGIEWQLHLSRRGICHQVWRRPHLSVDR